MNASTIQPGPIAVSFDANPGAPILSQAAASEIEAMRNEGVAAEIIAGIERPIQALIGLMTTFDRERAGLSSATASSDVEKQSRLSRLVTETHAKMVALVEGLRYDNRAAQLESELFKGADDAKTGDSLLDFLRQQEVRQILRARDAQFVVKAYASAIASGNGLVASAIENDPLGDLIPAEELRAVRQQRAEMANPILARKLADIRRAQSALRALVPPLPGNT
jgi:hypothetical protein